MKFTRRLLTTLVTGAILAACANGGTTSETPATTSPAASEPAASEPAARSSSTDKSTSSSPPTSETSTAPTTTESAPTSTDATVDTTSTSQPTTTSSTTTSTTAPPDDDVSPIAVELPDGEFVAAPGDLIVLRSNQALEYWPNALSPGNEAPHILLAAATQHDEFSSVSDVAGFVNGSVILAEPAAESVLAVDSPGSVSGPLAVGGHLQLSPDGTRLGLANQQQLAILDVATGEGISVLRDPSDDDDRPIVDLAWLDDDTLVAMTVDVDAGTYWLDPLDAETLAATRDAVELEAPARFAGRTADGLLGLVLAGADSLRVVYLDAELAERPELEQSFPMAGFSFIEIDPGGLGQVWVDGDRLFYLGPGQFEARELDRQVQQAWFVVSA